MKKEIQIISSNKHTKLHVTMWIPEKIKGILQIAHGMKEYVERYEEFAEYLCYRGILVAGNDHVGHGQSLDSQEERGYFRLAQNKNGAETAVADLHRVNSYLRKQYPGVPFYFLGHSMGSFFVRQYLSEYQEEFAGIILSGTGVQSGVVIHGGGLLLNLMEKKYGDKYKSDWLGNQFNKINNAKIENPRTPYDWLSTDRKKVEEYIRDKNCDYFFSVNGYRTLLETLAYIQNPQNVKKISKNTSFLFVSGSEDPIGGYGKGLGKVVRTYRKAGIGRIKIKMYEGSRHEPINESDRFSVYADIYRYIAPGLLEEQKQ